MTMSVEPRATEPRRHGAVITACALALLAFAAPLMAQAPGQAQLRVTVVDQTGASIPAAHVRASVEGALVREADVDRRGQVTLSALPVGVVQLQVEAGGFGPFSGSLTLRRGTNTQTVTLYIAGVQEEVVVTGPAGDTRGNSLTTTLEQDEIEELSDDPDELRAQLEAMTGGAGAVFNVDGFRGGRLPNRDEIRQIRFRTNSFSADNHDAGRVQVDIITRPGLTEWSGNANLGLRTDVLNARNAFARTKTPEQFRRFTAGLRGPLVRNRTSLRFTVDGNRSFDSTTIVALRPEARIADQVKRPFEQTNVTVGLEHGLTGSQTLRLEYRGGEDERRNLGVGDFNLMERAFSRASTTHRVRTSVQSVFGRNALNELRVQWNGQESVSQSASSAPAVIVIDAFSTGGAGVSSEGSTRTLEIADDFDFNVGRRHAMRVGLLFEAGAFRNLDARNAPGTFTFSSLEAFVAGAPNTYTQRLGQLRTAFSQYQLGVYWQDDFRLTRALSLSVGVREELQTHVGDAMNVMPRVGFTFTPRRSRVTVRGGYGLFHDWYESELHDQTLRVTGEAGAQRDLLILNPGYPDPAGGAAATILGSGRVQAAPDPRMPYVHQASIGVERPITGRLTFQTSYNRIRGRNQLRSRNVNAPDAAGIRPEPEIGTVTQIESTGRSASDRVNVGLFYRIPQQRIFMSANYTWSTQRNHADSPLSLPADSLRPDAEWGPASGDVRHRANAMINVGLPLGLRAFVNGVASSAPPYTIITGRDDNGDGVSNDRPSGVGRNSARGAERFDLNVRLTRGFGFGGRRDNQRGGSGGGPVMLAAQGGGPGGGGPGGGPGGGGGGFFGGGGGADNSRFRVEFYVQGFNVLNRTNFVNFSGSLQSPFFGNPTSAAQARRMEVGLQFRF